MTVHVTRVDVSIECMLPAVDACVNSNNYCIHSSWRTLVSAVMNLRVP